MARIVVVGGRESGKTTFLALVYAAQVKSGSDRSDTFRFHLDLETIEEISEAFQQLMSGSFPDSATKEGVRGLRFRLTYRKPGLRVMSRLRSRTRTSGDAALVDLILVRNFEDEMSRLRRGASLVHVTLRDVLGTDGLAILVDSGKLATDEEGQSGSIETYDGNVESLLTTIQRSRDRHGPNRLHPIFVFSKFDSVDRKALRAAKVGDRPPGVDETGPRAAFAEALLRRSMPRTMAKLKERGSRGLRFAKPAYFLSWVHADPATPERREKVRVRRGEGGGAELDYSKDEYRALLEWMWNLATRDAP